ncbi:SGNH/GDSL hydrolase family protein [Algoriphagus namhaensis]
MLKQFLSYLSCFCIIAACSCSKEDNVVNEPIETRKMTYLALGDSYTIGEGVADADRYPNQLIPLLDNSERWEEPKIIAKTGWTVDELEAGINAETTLEASYDLVTLLIGVNNQYRGRSVEEYAVDFEKMLLRAIGFAGDKPDHVVVLSIPDWGITRFAKNRGVNQQEVAAGIDAYNQTKREICDKYGVKFIDITADYRAVGAADEMQAEDGLHPSALIYSDWAEKLAAHVNTINFNQ